VTLGELEAYRALVGNRGPIICEFGFASTDHICPGVLECPELLEVSEILEINQKGLSQSRSSAIYEGRFEH
jgi:hypothetical protein